jgi:hypothetical protein
MEKKQSSVDFLEDKLDGVDTGVSSQYFKSIIEQAKAMHREETEQFGAVCCFKTTQKNQWSLEGLYNETFL